MRIVLAHKKYDVINMRVNVHSFHDYQLRTTRLPKINDLESLRRTGKSLQDTIIRRLPDQRSVGSVGLEEQVAVALAWESARDPGVGV